MLLCLSSCLADTGNPLRHLEALHDAITAARRKRSPWFEAHASYSLAAGAATLMANAPAGARLDAPWARPSALLECLRRAEEARRRCKAVLPTQWMALLTAVKAPTSTLRPWLERCQRQGDRLGPGGVTPEMPRLSRDIASRCSGCGEPSSQLRACPCKKASYCRCAGSVCVHVCVYVCVRARALACGGLHSATGIVLGMHSALGGHSASHHNPLPPFAPTGRSTACQKAHWKEHKPVCSAARKGG
jgi:hypothetical protein